MVRTQKDGTIVDDQFEVQRFGGSIFKVLNRERKKEGKKGKTL